MPDVILRHVPGMAMATPVPVLDAATLGENRFRNEHVAHSRPCVIRGAVSHWAAVEKWRDPQYLKSACNHEVGYWPHERHVSVKRSAASQRSLPFGQAVDLIQTAEIAAFHSSMPPALAADLGGFSFFAPGEPGLLYPASRIIFFRNAGTTWHYHPFDETLMCQVKEPKRIGLLNVRNALHRYLRHIFFKEDYYDHPFAFAGLKVEDLPWFSASLEAGDALYIPPLWWHGVVAPSGEFGITVPVAWRSPLHVTVDSIRKMAAAEIDLLGTLPLAQLQALMDFAGQAGVGQEMKTAWDLGMREGRLAIGQSAD